MTQRQTYRLHYAPDNASLIVRLALEALGQPYEAVLVDRAVSAQNQPAYLRLNPNGLIPTLETPQGALFETGAILLWLTETHGALGPAPKDPTRGDFLKWLFFISNTLHPALRRLFYPSQYIGTDPAHQAALNAQTQAQLRSHLQKLDAAAGAGFAWLGAETPSVLDYYLGAFLRWLRLFPKTANRDWFVLTDTPQLHALAHRLDTRPEAQKAAMAEGLGATPFSDPTYSTPPEGSPT